MCLIDPSIHPEIMAFEMNHIIKLQGKLEKFEYRAKVHLFQ